MRVPIPCCGDIPCVSDISRSSLGCGLVLRFLALEFSADGVICVWFTGGGDACMGGAG